MPTKPQRRQLSPKKSSNVSVRKIQMLAMAIVVTAYVVERTFNFIGNNYFLPWGPPANFEQTLEYSPVGSSNDLLQAKHGKLKKIVERLEEGQTDFLVKGPETVVFGPQGTLYVMTVDSKLVKLTDFQVSRDDDNEANTVSAKATLVRELGVGQQLGGKFTTDGKTLYIADSLLGLVRIHNPEDPRSKMEIVQSSVKDAHGVMTRLLFADDVAVGPKSGKIFFSDASDIAPDRLGTFSWDVWHASTLDLLRGGPGTGRIIQYDPATDQATILATGLRFANGVAVDKDETFVLISETFGINVYKFHLEGAQKGTLEVVVASKDLPGYLDGVDCSWSGSGKCYAVLPGAIAPLHKLLHMVPSTLSILLRGLLMMLPRSLAPDPPPYAAVLEIDTKTNEFRLIQDPIGKDLSSLTGVTEYNNKLYLASLKHNYIGVYDLD